MTEPWDELERPMKATMILCDHAQVADGKMNLLGGGWTLTGPGAAPFGIALMIDVPWRLTNMQHTFRIELIDLDGNGVIPDGLEDPVSIEGQFEVGRPPGVRAGTSLPFMAAVNSGPIGLPPGGHFEWRLTINGDAHDDWRLPFSVRPVEGADPAE